MKGCIGLGVILGLSVLGISTVILLTVGMRICRGWVASELRKYVVFLGIRRPMAKMHVGWVASERG